VKGSHCLEDLLWGGGRMLQGAFCPRPRECGETRREWNER
jgi:hypothetical protein